MKNQTNQTWRNRAELSIAHGALTNSKRPKSFVDGVYPTHLTHGRGCYVWDTDGTRYVDFVCGLGCNILGYGNGEVASAIYERAALGVTLSLGTQTEVLAAEKVKELFPFIDRVRFLKTGSDACSAALRIARTYRGLGRVLSEGYHGHDDEFVSLTKPALGVYGEYQIEPFHGLEQIEEDVCAVIIEPIMTDMSDARIAWLRQLRAKCDETKTVLIFDEVITGFRFPKLSVSSHFGITPDLICLGKAIANGLPLSVVGGKKEIMECGQYFISSTFAGDTISLAAGLKTMTLLQNKYEVQYLWERGGFFLENFNSLWPEKIRIEGYPTRGAFKGDEETIALFCQEACNAGLLFHPKSWFFNFGHLDVIDQVLSTCRDIVTRLKTGAVTLRGEMPMAPFAAKVRSA